MMNRAKPAHRLSLTDAVAYLSPRPRSRNHSRTSSVSNSASNSPTQEFSDPVTERLRSLELCEHMLEEGKTEDAIVILERQRKSADSIDGKSDLVKLLTVGYVRLGKWEEVEKLVEEGFEGRDELLLDLAQRACEKKDWRTVEELLAFNFQGREDIQRQLAVEYYDRGEWDDAELLLADLFRGRKEYTAEGLKAMHMLANIKYNKKDYEEAEDYAVRAVNGRRIILGTQHVFYYQSVNLLVKVYEALGDAASVAETSAMLPIGFRYCAELEHLSHMPPKEAASKCGLNYLKDILQHDARSTWLLKEVRANIELSGKGVVGTGYGYSLIHAFADWGYLLAAQLLIEKGVDIEAKTKTGETPLMLASESGMESTAKMFLERGANIEATADDGATALLRAVRHSRIKLVKLLLRNNANIEASDSEGDTALNLAVMYSNEETVKYLLKKGADHEAQNNEGRTALLCAVTKGRHKNVEILLECGVNVDAKDWRGRSALNYAMGQYRNGTIAKMLQDDKRHAIRKEPNWFQRRLSASKISDA